MKENTANEQKSVDLHRALKERILHKQRDYQNSIRGLKHSLMNQPVPSMKTSPFLNMSFDSVGVGPSLNHSKFPGGIISINNKGNSNINIIQNFHKIHQPNNVPTFFINCTDSHQNNGHKAYRHRTPLVPNRSGYPPRPKRDSSCTQEKNRSVRTSYSKRHSSHSSHSHTRSSKGTDQIYFPYVDFNNSKGFINRMDHCKSRDYSSGKKSKSSQLFENEKKVGDRKQSAYIPYSDVSNFSNDSRSNSFLGFSNEDKRLQNEENKTKARRLPPIPNIGDDQTKSTKETDKEKVKLDLTASERIFSNYEPEPDSNNLSPDFSHPEILKLYKQTNSKIDKENIPSYSSNSIFQNEKLTKVEKLPIIPKKKKISNPLKHLLKNPITNDIQNSSQIDTHKRSFIDILEDGRHSSISYEIKQNPINQIDRLHSIEEESNERTPLTKSFENRRHGSFTFQPPTIENTRKFNADSLINSPILPNPDLIPEFQEDFDFQKHSENKKNSNSKHLDIQMKLCPPLNDHNENQEEKIEEEAAETLDKRPLSRNSRSPIQSVNKLAFNLSSHKKQRTPEKKNDYSSRDKNSSKKKNNSQHTTPPFKNKRKKDKNSPSAYLAESHHKSHSKSSQSKKHRTQLLVDRILKEQMISNLGNKQIRIGEHEYIDLGESNSFIINSSNKNAYINIDEAKNMFQQNKLNNSIFGHSPILDLKESKDTIKLAESQVFNENNDGSSSIPYLLTQEFTNLTNFTPQPSEIIQDSESHFRSQEQCLNLEIPKNSGLGKSFDGAYQEITEESKLRTQPRSNTAHLELNHILEREGIIDSEFYKKCPINVINMGQSKKPRRPKTHTTKRNFPKEKISFIHNTKSTQKTPKIQKVDNSNKQETPEKIHFSPCNSNYQNLTSEIHSDQPSPQKKPPMILPILTNTKTYDDSSSTSPLENKFCNSMPYTLTKNTLKNHFCDSNFSTTQKNFQPIGFSDTISSIYNKLIHCNNSMKGSHQNSFRGTKGQSFTSHNTSIQSINPVFQTQYQSQPGRDLFSRKYSNSSNTTVQNCLCGTKHKDPCNSVLVGSYLKNYSNQSQRKLKGSGKLLFHNEKGLNNTADLIHVKDLEETNQKNVQLEKTHQILTKTQENLQNLHADGISLSTTDRTQRSYNNLRKNRKVKIISIHDRTVSSRDSPQRLNKTPLEKTTNNNSFRSHSSSPSRKSQEGVRYCLENYSGNKNSDPMKFELMNSCCIHHTIQVLKNKKYLCDYSIYLNKCNILNSMKEFLNTNLNKLDPSKQNKLIGLISHLERDLQHIEEEEEESIKDQ